MDLRGVGTSPSVRPRTRIFENSDGQTLDATSASLGPVAGAALAHYEVAVDL